MPHRRYNAAVTRPRKLNKIAVAVFYLFLYYAAPTDSIIVQFAVPFVITKRYFVGIQSLFRHFALRPGFGALQIFRFAFVIETVPSAEQIANVLCRFRLLALDLVLGYGLGRFFIVVGILAFLILLIGFLSLSLFGRD